MIILDAKGKSLSSKALVGSINKKVRYRMMPVSHT